MYYIYVCKEKEYLARGCLHIWLLGFVENHWGNKYITFLCFSKCYAR